MSKKFLCQKNLVQKFWAKRIKSKKFGFKVQLISSFKFFALNKICSKIYECNQNFEPNKIWVNELGI